MEQFSKEKNGKENKVSFRSVLEPLIVLFNKAVDANLKGKNYVIDYSIPGGIYGYFENYNVTETDLQNILKTIKQFIAQRISLEKFIVDKNGIYEYFKGTNRRDILDLITSKNNSHYPQDFRLVRVNQFGEVFLNDVNEDYEKLANIDLIKFREGFILIADRNFFERILPKDLDNSKFVTRFDELDETMSYLGVNCIADLNNIINNNGLSEFIKISEAFQAKKIGNIADMIVNDERKPRCIFIAGPTSSGKTTFANRLAIELKVLKKKTLILSLDNYYLPHSQIPFDPETGQQNFEVITALDLDLFKKDITTLINGEEVYLPKYDFGKGGHFASETPTRITPDTIVIVEGIHGLNPLMWKHLGEIESFRIYISAMNPLNIHSHLPMSTSDHRLIRRLIRDFLFRGYDFNETISRWPDVMESEFNNIFPFQESAHIVFNSALLYEIAVFAHIAPTILKPEEAANKTIQYHVERLNRLLSLFIGINPNEIPPTSILREFIGGSSFKY